MSDSDSPAQAGSPISPPAGGVPGRVKLRVGDGEPVLVPAFRPAAAAGARHGGCAPGAPASGDVAQPTPAPGAEAAPWKLAFKPVLAVIEAVPAGAEQLALAVADLMVGSGHRFGVVGLDKSNRLGARLGVPALAPPWCWKQAVPELLVEQGLRVIVPGPATEGELGSEEVGRVLQKLHDRTDGMLVDLGCRWEPRLFRPVLAMASHVWVLTRAGQWSGAEMRLQQAEFSGWTDMRRVRVIATGSGLPPPGTLGAAVAAILPEADGDGVRAFIARELGRV